MILTIITFVAVLSLLVFVHEFGHFITAKKSGISVEEFGFGFPPRIFGVKKGETLYSINWIPLGGFVKIKGEAGEHAHDKDSFANKGAHIRLAVLVAGVIMNVVLAWFLLSLGYLIGMPQAIDTDLSKFARVADAKVQVVDVLDGSPAAKADIQSGDTIVSVGGTAVSTIDAVRALTGAAAGTSERFVVSRNGATLQKDITPAVLDETDKQPAIGVELVTTGMVSYPIWMAPVQGAVATYTFGSDIVGAFAGLIGDLFARQKVAVDFSGPVGIAILTSEVAAMGIRYLIQFTALLSLNLAVINILPFPALDGGRVLFLVIEKVRGRAVSRRIENAAHNIGFAVLMLLVLVVTYGDLIKFGGRITGGLSRIFGG
jgi:regulator of sigma E protease